MMHKTTLLILFLMSCLILHAQENGIQDKATTAIYTAKAKKKLCAACCRPDGEAPAGVMTDHIHPKGQWMFSYSYMSMYMSGNKKGSNAISDSEILYQSTRDPQYQLSPQSMRMDMHMLMAMYGITSKWTLMAMLNYVKMDMTMKMNNAGMLSMMMANPNMVMTGTDADFLMKMSTSGISDTKISALYSIKDRLKYRLVGSIGLSLPTGSCTQNGMTLNDTNGRLAYNMQLGTGSYALLPGLTYVYTANNWSAGAVASADVKLNNNAQGYKWGNIYDVSAWYSYKILSFLSLSVRADAYTQGQITGYDAKLYPLTSSDPTADIKNTGGTHALVYGGFNFYKSDWMLSNFHLVAEYGLPVYENLNGIQTAQKSNFIIGLQFMMN